jgi:hypothetical protein
MTEGPSCCRRVPHCACVALFRGALRSRAQALSLGLHTGPNCVHCQRTAARIRTHDALRPVPASEPAMPGAGPRRCGAATPWAARRRDCRAPLRVYRCAWGTLGRRQPARSGLRLVVRCLDSHLTQTQLDTAALRVESAGSTRSSESRCPHHAAACTRRTAAGQWQQRQRAAASSMLRPDGWRAKRQGLRRGERSRAEARRDGTSGAASARRQRGSRRSGTQRLRGAPHAARRVSPLGAGPGAAAAGTQHPYQAPS